MSRRDRAARARIVVELLEEGDLPRAETDGMLLDLALEGRAALDEEESFE